MSETAIPAQNTRFIIVWIALVAMAGLMTISYLIMIFAESNHALFTSYTGLSLYGFLVLLIPFRECKRWAWMATWILPVVMALTGFFAPEFAPYYYGAAVVSGLGLLLTMQDFFSKR